MKRHATLLVLVLVLTGCATQSSQRPAVGAEALYQQTLTVLDQVEGDLPAIEKSAAQAAELYCSTWQDMGLGSDGNPCFFAELTGRSGGVMAMGAWWIGERPFRGIVLYCLQGRDRFARDLNRIAFYNARGCKVFLFGPPDLLERAALCGAQAEGMVSVPNSAVAGVSTYDLAAISVGWVWTCEFVAACTRLGQTPVIFQSIAVPTGKARMEKYSYKPPTSQRMYHKFHEQSIAPLPSGALGRQWLTVARQRLGTLHTREMADIHQAAGLAVASQHNGGKLWFRTNGHALGQMSACAYNPPHFTDMARMPKGTELSDKDFVLGIAYINIFDNDKMVQRIRDSKCRVAWSAAAFVPEGIKTLPGELFIEQPWAYGDADVTLPGYDTKMAPTSGLLSTVIYLMISAEMNTMMQPSPEKED